MRTALNDNPIVQVVVLGMLGIVVAVLFMTRVASEGAGGEGGTAEPAPADSAPAPATAEPAAEPSVSADAGARDESGTEASPVAVGFEPGAGLPTAVVEAHDGGDAVALLVVNRRGTEDRKLESQAGRLDRRANTSVFIVDARGVARYSRIAQGVDLDRVPAFVVIEPQRQAEGALPEATVAYGFRGPESLEQVIRDALYDGRELPFHPR